MTFGISAATAAVVGGGLAAAGAVGGALISANGAKSAANTQASAQDQAAADQLQMFNTINQQEQPFIQAGQGATATLQQLLGLTAGGGAGNGLLMQTSAQPFSSSEVTSSPGYQFAQQQGLQQVANNEAPNVGALSGPALKALTSYATGTAAQYYNDYFNQANTQFNQQQTAQTNIFDRLSGIAGLGQNAASQVGTAGTQLGTGASQAIASAGGSQAAGTVGSANALAGGLSGAGNTLGSYLTLGNMLSNGGNGGASAEGVPGWTPSTGGS